MTCFYTHIKYRVGKIYSFFFFFEKFILFAHIPQLFIPEEESKKSSVLNAIQLYNEHLL